MFIIIVILFIIGKHTFLKIMNRYLMILFYLLIRNMTPYEQSRLQPPYTYPSQTLL